jgi:hypothetical protein
MTWIYIREDHWFVVVTIPPLFPLSLLIIHSFNNSNTSESGTTYPPGAHWPVHPGLVCQTSKHLFIKTKTQLPFPQ